MAQLCSTLFSLRQCEEFYRIVKHKEPDALYSVFVFTPSFVVVVVVVVVDMFAGHGSTMHGNLAD